MRSTIKNTAKLLGMPQQTLRIFIQNGKFQEFATATRLGKSNHWTYYINERRLLNYLGIEKESTQKEEK
ncbi:hypothetical protein ACEXAJ_04780 [Fusobacterium necrophorum subsp. funduliforme]